MNKTPPTALATTLKSFFRSHLVQTMGTSIHTVRSYRDSLKLLLRFLADGADGVVRLDFDDLSVDKITAFLAHLEMERGNSAGTRNNRLAAVHCFFRYVASVAPENVELAQRVLAIPFKKTTSRVVEYFEFAEVEAMLAQIDRCAPNGRRDYALLTFMFNTGARAQEVCDLLANDLSLSQPFSVRIAGKGDKERICPLWTATAHLLRELMQERSLDPRDPVAVFTNVHGNPLTRFGLRYILAKYERKAKVGCTSLMYKRLHPHSMRHSTAVHLLKSGVDLPAIASWLGHASVDTTGRYATVDLEMKRKAIAKAISPGVGNNCSSWRKDSSILAWLESL